MFLNFVLHVPFEYDHDCSIYFSLLSWFLYDLPVPLSHFLSLPLVMTLYPSLILFLSFSLFLVL